MARTGVDDLEQRIEQAMRTYPRQAFLPEAESRQASADMPLPIGHGQTNSQPTTVKRMLMWLQPQVGNRVLDVGSGSGWTSALLAELVGPGGRVYAVEKIPELREFGEENARQFTITNVSFHLAEDSYGLATRAPFDRILVSAAAEELPQELISQLAKEARAVIPVQDRIHVLQKRADGALEDTPHSGYRFVPLV